MYDHGKFCRCSHTARSHDHDGCRMVRYMSGKRYECPCAMSAERVERGQDNFERVAARVNRKNDPFSVS